MTRKLMMNNVENNELTPVTDGLYCWFDARDLKINDTVWKDRMNTVNNMRINANTINSQNFTGTSLLTSNTHFFQSITLNTAKCSITLVSKPTSDNYSPFNSRICGLNGSNGAGYYFWYSHMKDTLCIYKDYETICEIALSENNILPKNILYITVTFGQYVNAYLNGTRIYKQLANTNTVKFGTLLLGTTSTNSYVQQELYSSKLYNKELTEQEVYADYNYEKSIERS